MKVFFCIKKTECFGLVPKVKLFSFGGLSSKTLKVDNSYKPERAGFTIFFASCARGTHWFLDMPLDDTAYD